MLFCMRVMVGVIILYDHVHPVGAFAKTSKIDVSDAAFFFNTNKSLNEWFDNAVLSMQVKI